MGGATRTAGVGGAAGTANRLGGALGGLGGAQGGLGGAQGGLTGGQIIALPRNIAYTATLRFPGPIVTPVQMQSSVQGVLERSSMISNRGLAVAMDGGAVVLRGRVKDEDEARLVEGMVRLTPGVRDVKNELTFPPTP